MEGPSLINKIGVAVFMGSIRLHLDGALCWLFGSYARGEATEKSDVDLLISYQNLIGMFALGGVYSDMEDAFNKPVDIVSERALTASYASVSSKQLLMNARKDGIQIYGKKQ